MPHPTMSPHCMHSTLATFSTNTSPALPPNKDTYTLTHPPHAPLPPRAHFPPPPTHPPHPQTRAGWSRARSNHSHTPSPTNLPPTHLHIHRRAHGGATPAARSDHRDGAPRGDAPPIGIGADPPAIERR
eukprot:336527-Chlamydomonas_euryale.AAC.1